MKKEILGRKIAAALVLCLFLLAAPVRASGYSYGGDVSIGLSNMASDSIQISFTGSYRMGEDLIKSGTSLSISLKDGKIISGERVYDSITLQPENRENLIKLKMSYVMSGKTLVKEYSYRGAMNFKVSGGKILPINTLDIEDYLVGVVPYEMSNSNPLEALKAQAVAARNYAIANLGKHGNQGFDLDDTTHCQVYRGYNPYYKNAISAVEETEGLVLLHNGNLVTAYFSASNGGYTEACENVWVQSIPYLKSKPDIYDNNDSYNWTKTFTTLEIENMLRDRGYIGKTDSFKKLDVDNIKFYESGRVSKLDIIYKTSGGQEKTKTLSKEAARIFLSLNSSMYEVTFENDSYTFKGRGYGHGIGLSQIGASARARAGKTFDEILAFYYDDTYLEGRREGINELEISKEKALVGDKITLRVEPLLGKSPLYKYVIKKDGEVMDTLDFKGEDSLEYKFSVPGEYIFEAYIKDRGSRQEYDDMKSASVKVFTPPVIKEIRLNPAKVYVGKPLEVKVISEGGSPGGLEYKIELLCEGKVIDSKAGVDTWSFSVSKEGQYEVRAALQDVLGDGGNDELKSIKFTAEKEFVIPKGTETLFKSSRVLKRGMSGSDVKSMQEALKTLGFFSRNTAVTTCFGPISEFALKSFQANVGLKATGVLDAETAAKINLELVKLKLQAKPGSSTEKKAALKIGRTLKFGMIGDDVKELQQGLAKLGYFKNASLTTYFGTATRAAVMDIQKKNGLTADGILGRKTLEKINSLFK